MKRCLSLALLLTSSLTAHAVLITTLDFTDGNWSASLDQTATVVNGSSATATTITAVKTSGPTGYSRIIVNLTGSISTAGFQGITLGFDGLATGGLEWNYPGSGTASDDGLLINGSDIDINTFGINGTAAETDFDNGTTFPTVNFGTDFDFDNSVDNGSITALTFNLKVNAASEQLAISNVQLFGTAVAIPEPSMGFLVLLALGVLRRFRRA